MGVHHEPDPVSANGRTSPLAESISFFALPLLRCARPTLDGTVILRDAQNYGICRYRSLL